MISYKGHVYYLCMSCGNFDLLTLLYLFLKLPTYFLFGCIFLFTFKTYVSGSYKNYIADTVVMLYTCILDSKRNA